MHERNYLNLTPADLDTEIYRIVSFKRFKELFETRRNTLVTPAQWDDPFENFILKCPVRLATGELAHIDFHDRYFGQCWTLNRASDAMWRIYSPNKDGIRMRTTIRRLAESLSSQTGEWSAVSTFIGRVQYLSRRRLEALAKDAFARLDPQHFARTLLVKRPAFEHEREIRLIYHKPDASPNREKFFSYSIDPDSLITQVMCDPRQTDAEYRAIREAIHRVGYRGSIKHSLLYAPPPRFELRFK
jgi:hypothetical protein